MRRDFRYRPHVRYMPHAVAALGALFFLACLTLAGFSTGPEKYQWLGAAAVLGVAYGAIWWCLYRMSDTAVTIMESGLLVTNRDSSRTIAFEDISALRYPSVRYVGGWVKICHPEKNLRLTVVLDGITDFLVALQRALDIRGLHDRYDERTAVRFFRTAAYAEQSWDRLYAWWKVLLGALGGSMLAAFLLSRFLDLSAPATILLVGGAVEWPLCVLIVVELVLIVRFARACPADALSLPERNIGSERRLIRNAALGVFCLYVAAGAVVVLHDFDRLPSVARPQAPLVVPPGTDLA